MERDARSQASDPLPSDSEFPAPRSMLHAPLQMPHTQLPITHYQLTTKSNQAVAKKMSFNKILEFTVRMDSILLTLPRQKKLVGFLAQQAN